MRRPNCNPVRTLGSQRAAAIISISQKLLSNYNEETLETIPAKACFSGDISYGEEENVRVSIASGS